MKIGYYRTDCAGNSYVVPESKIKEFEDLDNKICETESYTDEWYELIDKFNIKYGQYTVEGELYNYKIIMEEEI